MLLSLCTSLMMMMMVIMIVMVVMTNEDRTRTPYTLNDYTVDFTLSPKVETKLRYYTRNSKISVLNPTTRKPEPLFTS